MMSAFSEETLADLRAIAEKARLNVEALHQHASGGDQARHLVSLAEAMRACASVLEAVAAPKWITPLVEDLKGGVSDRFRPVFAHRWSMVAGHLHDLPAEAGRRVQDRVLVKALGVAASYDTAGCTKAVISILSRRIAGEDVAGKMKATMEAISRKTTFVGSVGGEILYMIKIASSDAPVDGIARSAANIAASDAGFVPTYVWGAAPTWTQVYDVLAEELLTALEHEIPSYKRRTTND